MAGFERDQILGLILTTAVIVLLLLLLFRIIGSFNETDEIAQATMEKLKVALAEADDGYVGEFVWDDGKYILVYFGENSIVESKWGNFVTRAEKNKACVCYYEFGTFDLGNIGKSNCPVCMNFDKPFYSDGVNELSGASCFSAYTTVKIKSNEKGYFFVDSSQFGSCGNFEFGSNPSSIDVSMAITPQDRILGLGLPSKELLTEEILIEKYGLAGIDLNNWNDVAKADLYCSDFFVYMERTLNIQEKKDRDLVRVCQDDGILDTWEDIKNE